MESLSSVLRLMNTIFYALAAVPTPKFWLPFLFFVLSFICNHLQSRLHHDSQLSLLDSVTNLALRATLFRAVLVFSILSHEISHLLAAAAISRQPIHALFSLSNLCGNVPFYAWICALCPFIAWPRCASRPHVILPIEQSGVYKSSIRLAGPLFSLCLSTMSFLSWSSSFNEESAIFVLGTGLVMLGSISSDVIQFLDENPRTTFHCGNFGLLVICAMDRFGLQIPEILRDMAEITAARGGQAGGIVTLLPDGNSHRFRFVPSKRADVSKGLIHGFFRGLWLREMIAKKAVDCKMFLGHTRFATSSKPSTAESHPHRFSQPKNVHIWRPSQSGWKSSIERFEIFVTHNGDFDYWSVFGKVRTQHEVGCWLKYVLEASHTIPMCDSVKVGGVMELLRTQGIWEHSMRLAYLHSVAPNFEETARGKNVFGAMIRSAASIADKVFESYVQGHEFSHKGHVHALSQALSTALCDSANIGLFASFPSLMCIFDDFSTKAVSYFFENDIYQATVQFLRDAQGSFGLTMCCTLDRNVVCIASRGQAMSVSFNPEAGVILWGSEGTTQMVQLTRTQDSKDQIRVHNSCGIVRCTHRHDLDENFGEVVEIAILPDLAERICAETAALATVRESSKEIGSETPHFGRFQPFESSSLCLRVFKYSESSMLSRDSFLTRESLISLDSDMVDVPPPHSSKDRVEADLRDIPRVLSCIRADWDNKNGRNRQTAEELFRLIQNQIKHRMEVPGGRLEVDVLITGVEASLWIGEQFASDLQTLLPSLRVVPISANKIVGVLSNVRGTAPMAGFAFSSLTLSLKKAIVIAISHSGQTFPTLHATHALRKVCGDRVFVLCGSVDSKMSAAVGQHCYSDAEWVRRVFCTFSGWRPAEALTVSTVACHHTLSELLLFLASESSKQDNDFRVAAGFKFVTSDVSDIKRLNRSFALIAAPSILGVDYIGKDLAGSQANLLRRQGQRWALHILETPYAWCLSSAYIFGTIVSGKPLFSALQERFLAEATETPFQEIVKYIALILDALLYCFLPLVFSIILRIIQGRPLAARLGKRTIVIGDVPYVHQLLESYVSKLFSLSYSIASVDVHGANAVDHLVHRFTHRVVRGLLIAVGRPDGRLYALVKAESWVLMALQQCKSIVHLVSPPEILTVGHNTFVNHNVVDVHLALEKKRPNFFSEVISDVHAVEPLMRSATFRSIAQSDASEIELELDQTNRPMCTYNRETGPKRDPDQFLATQLQSLYGDRELQQNCSIPNYFDLLALDLSTHGSMHGVLEYAPPVTRATLADGLHGRRTSITSGPRLLSDVLDRDQVGPERWEALGQASGGAFDKLTRGSAVELWYENRYASQERYIAFLIVFHAMAARVASFWPLRFDVARSQSQLRVATTAAPISAADLEREWAYDAFECAVPSHEECARGALRVGSRRQSSFETPPPTSAGISRATTAMEPLQVPE